MVKHLTLIVLFSGSAFGACLPLTGDRILGRDLALALPAFSSLPAGMTIGYAPAPATQRVFSAPELFRIARANKVALTNPSEVCFEIPMRTMTAEEALEAMRRVLPPETELSIIELPKTSIPAGRVEFLLAGMEPVVRGSRLWHGFVRYGETLKTPIQARVTVRRKYLAVVAVKDLAANLPIDSASLGFETVAVPMESERLALHLEEVVGHVPRRAIRAGDAVPVAILNIPPTVRRGDAIKVEVRSGTARLTFDAVAQGSAANGEMVELRNPSSGRTFRARVQESGRAVLVVSSGQTL